MNFENLPQFPIVQNAENLDYYIQVVYFLAVCSFIIGACIGSYLNVCIYRIPLGQSTANPKRSYCFSCGSQILAEHNIPLISYWYLKGVCPNCGSYFSARYFGIELLTAILFVIAFWRYGLTPSVFAYFIFISLMIVATFTDIDNWIIPDRISLGGFVIGIVLSPLAILDSTHVLVLHSLNVITTAITFPMELNANANYDLINWLISPHWWKGIVNSIFGAAFGYSLLMFVRVTGHLLLRKEAMGLGDVKLFACIGAFMGWMNCLYVLMLASVLGSVFGLYQILHNKISNLNKDESQKGILHPLPFGPHIAVAAVIILLFQKDVPKFFEWFTTILKPIHDQLLGI